jgi:hypothetical protein
MERIDEEKVRIERQVRMWCKIRKYPFENYEKLSPSDKSVFHNIICEPQRKTSDKQRQDLLRNMFLPGNFVDGRDSIGSIDLIPSEKQGILLSPLTPEEKTHYFARF